MRAKSFVLAAVVTAVLSSAGITDASWRDRTVTTFEEGEALLAAVDARHESVSTEEVGRSTQDRPITAMTIGPGAEATWRVLLVGVQHGDEVAGREAILELVREFDANPTMLPEGVGLVLVPTMNPDGFIAGTRRNAAGFDLNRDHLFQTQPETRAMHALQRRTMAHLVVDCHEYGRDSSAWGEWGLYRWPTIMFGAGNLPLAAPAINAANAALVEQARPLFADNPAAFEEYIVGGVAPHEEQRLSNLEAFDLRNGLALYGGMSIIIESGRFTGHKPPNDDLPVRVEAYLRLLRLSIDPPQRAEWARAVRDARQQPGPEVFATKATWGQTAPRAFTMRAGRLADDSMVEIETYNFLNTPVYRAFARRPLAYAIAPEHAATFAPLIEAHGLAPVELTEPMQVEIEPVKIASVQAFDDAWDDPSEITATTEVLPRRAATLAAGTLLFAADEPVVGMRRCVVLEPTREYGLYGMAPFKELVVDPARESAVMRVVALPNDPLRTEQP